WPTNVPGLYYAYHIMVGLGTIFIGLMAIAAFLLWRKKLMSTKIILWAMMLAAPFPYIANTAGWYTSEMGRQPWLVYNLMRTTDGISQVVSSGNTLFTFLGFIGLYLLLGLLTLVLVGKLINEGPEPKTENA
ncbi:MAG: cytochrome ubiquinol oxidase subunit I, partial [Cyclobacteriaceae bacterium]|nr:cytochrome ubiquinol oxidase subunit I [Cyclobacteriaceae bacterium]